MVIMTTRPAAGAPARARAVRPLPGPDGHGEHRLAPAALRYENVSDLLVALIGAPLLAAAAMLIPDAGWRTGALIAIGAFTLLGLAVDLPFVNRWTVRNTSYTVTPEVVFIRRGLLVRRTITLATVQILNVEIVQGPLLRAFDLVKVRFTCIADVEGITGITAEAAREIRDTVLASQSARGDDDE